MEKEYIVEKGRMITLNLTDGKVDAYREMEESHTTVRVYDGNTIGIAGALGEADFSELEKAAESKLGVIPYPCKLNKGVKKSLIRNKPVVAEGELLRTGKRLAKKVAEACPRFLVNGKISAKMLAGSYKNTQNTELSHEGHSFSASFLLKDRASSNVFDASFGVLLTHYGKVTEDKIVADVKSLHDAFFTEKVTLPNGKYPVITSSYSIMGEIARDFIAEYYVSGGSLFSGKLGERIFNEKLTCGGDRNPKTNPTASFYDAEGEIAPDYRAKFVENGVLKRVVTTKNTAQMFNLPLSKTAEASYDGVPGLGFRGFRCNPTAADIPSLLGEEKAVLVLVTSGGDITTEGVLGLPVQLAFLVENGKITKRLTDFTISGNIKDVLGDDFIGIAEHGVFASDSNEVLVARMELINN